MLDGPLSQEKMSIGVGRRYVHSSFDTGPHRQSVTVEQKNRAGLRESASYERNGSEEIEEDGRARLRRERWPRDTFDQEAQKGKWPGLLLYH